MKNSLLNNTKQLTDVATKKKFLKWLRENHVPYALQTTGLFYLGAASCWIDDNYLCGSFGQVFSTTHNDLKCSIYLGDCFTAYNRFAFINNKYCDLSHALLNKRLREIELPKILREAALRDQKRA